MCVSLSRARDRHVPIFLESDWLSFEPGELGAALYGASPAKDRLHPFAWSNLIAVAILLVLQLL